MNGMDYTPRMKQILLVLLQEPEAISVKYLSEQIGVSKRTVQREMEYLNQSLAGHEIQFMSKTGVGVWLEGSGEAKHNLLQELVQGDDYDVSNKEERRKRLILEILKEKGFQKLYYYSSQFGVSEATVSADLDAVEAWLESFGLRITRKPGSGVAVEGSEENFRRAIRAFIDENIDTRVLRESYEESGDRMARQHGVMRKSNLPHVLSDDIMKRVCECVMGIRHSRIQNMTESAYTGLIIHIAIAVNRILKNEVIEADDKWQQRDDGDEDYRLAEKIANELEEEFEIVIPEIEVSYICLHIKGAKHEKIQWDGKAPLEIESREMRQLVNEMLQVFDTEQAYLLRQDEEFIQGLLAHLQPTLIRLGHDMQIHNPVLGDIQKNYPEIYKKCKKVAEVLGERIGKTVPEEEVGFLAVHFGAAIVRLEGKREEIRKVHVGVVCSSGIGISRLMSSKLKKIFRDQMEIVAYGAKDITPYVAGKTDFFVSSITMEPYETPVIYVNPLLNEEDVEQIRRMTYKYGRMPEKHKEADEFSVQLEEINLVAAQINTVIKHMNLFKVNNRISFDELLIAVSEKMSPYSDRQEMIREDLLKREKISSQIFAEFGFALLHARTKGVIRPEFSICMTKDLGAFQNPYLKGITVVFIMLAPVDDHGNINHDILGYISSLLIEKPDFMDIVSGGDKEEIRDALSRYLKKYFNQYISTLT